MAYEIPQQLQHKERVIFGLTFVQLGWSVLFGTIFLLIVSSKGDLTIRLILALFPFFLGILFVFFDMSKWSVDLWHYVMFRKANLMSAKMKKLVSLRKIKDGVVLAEEELAVLQVFPINFGIRTDDDKGGVILGFQKFLNSLDFPIQMIMTSNGVDMNGYLDGLKKRVENLDLYNDFASFINKTIHENNIQNRNFYIVIPKRSELNIQTRLCKEKLEGMGLKVNRLYDRELLKFYFSYFNNNSERSMHGEADNALQYLLAPNSIENELQNFKVNDKYCSVVAASGYPRMVESGFLDKIISSNEDFDLSIHIEPFSIEATMIMLNQELQKQRADLFAEELKKSINPSLEIKYTDTRKVLEALQKGNEKLFNVSLYINCKAQDKEELTLLVKKVESELNSLMIVPRIPLFRQISAYKAMIPIAKDTLGVKRNITTTALSAFFPFTSPFLTIEPNGVMLGLNKNKVPLIRDIFGLSNANGLILATSGSGKSYFTKLLIARQLLNQTKVMVIDPQAEYLGLVKSCKGELVTISRNSKTIINPLDLMGHDFIEKRLALMDLFKIMFGELSEIQKSILDKAISETYARKGITADAYKYKKPPILGDLYKVLIEMDKKASQMEKITYRALINRLYMYTEGVFGFINTQSSINFDNDFVCFNIGDMPKQVKPVIMFLILDYVYMKMKQDKGRKLLVVDEAWSLLGHAEEASYIFEIVKTCRKFNLGLLLITQDVADLVNSKAGHAVLANSSYSLLLRQKPAIIEGVVKTFNLSQMEKDYLLTATKGKGILIMDNDHQELEVIASQKEHKLITTNADEILAQRNKKKINHSEIDIGLDLIKSLYYGRALDLEQKNYLYNHGYKPGNFVPIGKPRQEECWIKANSVESLEHTFLVENVKQQLLNYTKSYESSITKDADIKFKNNQGREIILEVETGLSYNKNKKELKDKFEKLLRQFPNRVIIILTDKDFKRQYERLIPEAKVLLRQDVPLYLSTQFKRKIIPAKRRV